jgi:hypothetical protein
VKTVDDAMPIMYKNMPTKTLFTATIVLMILTACSGGKKIPYSGTDRVSDFSGTEGYTAIYNLPAGSFLFSVEATRSVTKRGPYFQYAEKYLGISGVPFSDSERWSITNVEMTERIEADPETYFVLTASGKSAAWLSLVREGLIIPVTRPGIVPSEARFVKSEDEEASMLFTDLSVQRSVIQETKSSARFIQQDTAFVSVPVLRKEVVRKTLEEKAKEAADFIIDLRMNRFKLISGEYDLFPDGEAMKAILAEYRRLEEEYLALFIGKTFSQVYTTNFEYSPTGKEDLEQTVLFRFSENQGILPSENLLGRPVLLEIGKENKTASLSRLSVTLQNESKNRIFYRIPDAVNVRLMEGDKILFTSRASLSQAGKVLSVPFDFKWD